MKKNLKSTFVVSFSICEAFTSVALGEPNFSSNNSASPEIKLMSWPTNKH